VPSAARRQLTPATTGPRLQQRHRRLCFAALDRTKMKEEMREEHGADNGAARCAEKRLDGDAALALLTFVCL
jgi:hypothetical protein